MNGHKNEDQKNLLLAIVLCTGVLFGWQAMFPAPPVAEMPPSVEQTVKTPAGVNPSVPSGTANAQSAVPGQGGTQPVAAPIERKTVANVDVSSVHGIELTNDDGQLAAWILNEEQYRVEAESDSGESARPFRFVDGQDAGPPSSRFLPPLLELELNGKKTRGDYRVVEEADNSVALKWKDPLSGIEIAKRYTLSSQGHTVDVELSLTNNSTSAVSYDIEAIMRGLQNDEDSGGSMFMPPIHLYEVVCRRGEDFERFPGTEIQENIEDGEPNSFSDNIQWGGVDNRYFITAMYAEPGAIESCSAEVSKEGVPPGYSLLSNRIGLAGGQIAPGEIIKRKVVLFGGPKKMVELQAQPVALNDAIDFGFFSAICVPMLWLMRFFHGHFPNWGLAIILLTVLVKLITLPLTLKQYKSMAGMKKIQPKMKKLQEKYKEDKVRMQQELMKLYKDNNVNPLSGCLPMLMMMPIYFALYRTIYSAVELYQADFVLWITDLSEQDPYYITPLLLGVLMFIQMRLNPTAGDQAQAKIMMNVMPIMFTAMMLFLPSGLVVYILVNTVLGIGQQFYMYRKTDTPVGTPAKA